jgi:ABC-type multidrug transport system fused ATPase/permease subunit
VVVVIALTTFCKFRNVDFKYAPAFPLVLNNVSFKLPHASKVGIVGRTGSGKSTLLVALFRLIQPLSGAIVVDNCSTLVRILSARCALRSMCLF